MVKSGAFAVTLALTAGWALTAEAQSPLWTGFYAGLNAGYTEGGSDAVNLGATQTFLVGPRSLGTKA